MMGQRRLAMNNLMHCSESSQHLRKRVGYLRGAAIDNSTHIVLAVEQLVRPGNLGPELCR